MNNKLDKDDDYYLRLKPLRNYFSKPRVILKEYSLIEISIVTDPLHPSWNVKLIDKDYSVPGAYDYSEWPNSAIPTDTESLKLWVNANKDFINEKFKESNGSNLFLQALKGTNKPEKKYSFNKFLRSIKQIFLNLYDGFTGFFSNIW